MPCDCREVRPRNFPPRPSSGASRRFFSVTCLLAALVMPAVAHDRRTLSPATIVVAAEDQPPEPEADLQAANDFGLKPMSAMSIDIAPPRGEGGHPEDFAAARFDRERTIDPAQNVGREWALTDYRWEASMLCHAPLLFEQVNAERYGITYGCWQPMISGAHFFATVPAVPYKVWANGHDQRQYALGYYRPGSYAQPQCYKPRISADASLFEAGVILGLIYALP